MLSEMMLPKKKKRHNPLDVKGSTDFLLLSKLWRGQERSRAHPHPVDAALDSDALALDVAWGCGRASSLFPETWLQRRGSQGWWAPVYSQKQSGCAQQTQGAQGCTRQLPGRNAVPHFPLPLSGVEIPSASWRGFPRQGWSMVFPRRSFNKSRNIPHVTKKAAHLV